MTMGKNKPANTAANDTALKLDILKADLANKEREIVNLGKATKDVTERLALVEEQIELRRGIHKLAQDNFGILEPKWAWEGMPEVLALNKRLSNNEFQFKMKELEAHVETFKKNIDTYKTQVESLEKSKAKLLAEISELEK